MTEKQGSARNRRDDRRRSAKDAIKKVKEYADEGYTFAVDLDLEKYFDTINHERLLSLLRRHVEDERVVQLIKRFLKSGVMENSVVMETEEGSPQGWLRGVRGMAVRRLPFFSGSLLEFVGKSGNTYYIYPKILNAGAKRISVQKQHGTP